MGYSNSKVRKFVAPPTSPETNKSENKPNHSGLISCISADADLSNHGTNNNNRILDSGETESSQTSLVNKDDEDSWISPGMVDDRHLKSNVITSEALINGKKKLKSTSQSNNNCNNESTLPKGERDPNNNNNPKLPIPKPRSHEHRYIPMNTDSFGKLLTEKTAGALSRGDDGTNHEELSHLVSEVDQLTSEIFGNFLEITTAEINSKISSSNVTLETRRCNKPLPAPRFSKKRVGKKILNYSHPSRLREKDDGNVTAGRQSMKTTIYATDNSESTKPSSQPSYLSIPVYEEYEKILMEEIEKEFES